MKDADTPELAVDLMWIINSKRIPNGKTRDAIMMELVPYVTRYGHAAFNAGYQKCKSKQEGDHGEQGQTDTEAES